MNERIRKLFEENCYPNFGLYEGLQRKPNGEYLNDVLEDHWQTFQEGFELAVKECAYLINHHQRTTGYTTHAKILCDEFGIEFKEEDYFGDKE